MTDSDSEYQRYKRFREKGRILFPELVSRLRSAVLKKCGKELGLLKNGALIFGSEAEMSILMDYCIHSQRIGAKSFIDTFIEQSSYEALSDEMMLLKEMSCSHFTVLSVTSTEKKYLLHALDVLRQEGLTLIDSGLGQTVKPGLLLATRLRRLPASDFYMTAGAAIPITSRAALDGVGWVIKKYAPAIESGGLSISQERSFSKQLIRMLLRTQSQDDIQYADVIDPKN
jgi:hypothetical protein